MILALEVAMRPTRTAMMEVVVKCILLVIWNGRGVEGKKTELWTGDVGFLVLVLVLDIAAGKMAVLIVPVRVLRMVVI